MDCFTITERTHMMTLMWLMSLISLSYFAIGGYYYAR
jgi:hypothetical protein